MSKMSIERPPDARLQRCRTAGSTLGTRWSAPFHAPIGCNVPAVVEQLGAAVRKVDAQMSNWRDDSDLSRLNRTAPGEWIAVAPNLATVLTRALSIGRATGNAFNIASVSCRVTPSASSPVTKLYARLWRSGGMSNHA